MNVGKGSIYINGIQDPSFSNAVVEETILHPNKYKAVKVIESPHPYLDSQDIYCIVDIPDAVELEITFDPRSATESTYDYIRFNSVNNR